MVTGVVVPYDDILPLELRQFDGLADDQKAVDGFVEVVDLDIPPSTLFIHSDGKTLRLPVNQRATLLLWLANQRHRRRDVICGSAVLVGPPDEGTLPERPGRTPRAPHAGRYIRCRGSDRR